MKNRFLYKKHSLYDLRYGSGCVQFRVIPVTERWFIHSPFYCKDPRSGFKASEIDKQKLYSFPKTRLIILNSSKLILSLELKWNIYESFITRKNLKTLFDKGKLLTLGMFSIYLHVITNDLMKKYQIPHFKTMYRGLGVKRL